MRDWRSVAVLMERCRCKPDAGFEVGENSERPASRSAIAPIIPKGEEERIGFPSFNAFGSGLRFTTGEHIEHIDEVNLIITEFIKLGYANPAAASASADYTIVNVILLPLFTIIDGRRRGIRRPWLFFVSSLFTSCAFG